MSGYFWVSGVPRPQGSKNFLGASKNGKPRFKETSPELQAWRTDIRSSAEKANLLFYPKGIPVDLELVFVMPRPASHYLPANSRRPVRELRTDAPEYHTSKPDADKLTRAVKDSLTSVVFDDDSQVAHVEARKIYGERPGVMVQIGRALTTAGYSALDRFLNPLVSG